MEYFLSNKLFSCKQYGFIKGRCTVLQLLKLVDQWTSDLESGGQIDILYTDLEKAFDKISHFHLLCKLKSYGVSEILIKWIESFLFNRQHRVRINN
jgi:hypothetical protein